jgi:hypothetical protein
MATSNSTPIYTTLTDVTVSELIWCRGEPLNPIARRVMQALGFTEGKSWHSEISGDLPLPVQ